MARYADDLYHFTFNAAGAVTRVAEVEKNGRLDVQRIDRDETYTLQGEFVVKTERDDGRTEWTVYADADKNGFWSELAEGHGAPDLASLGQAAKTGVDFKITLGSQDDRYAFGFNAAGQAVSVIEVDARGRWDNEGVDRDESYTLMGGFVLHQEIDDGRTEWTVYADGDGDGLWSEIAEGDGLIDMAAVANAFSSDMLALT